MEMGTHDTLRGVQVPPGWVTLPGGGIVPEKLNRPTGWQDDRDTVNTSAVIRARREMSEAVAAYRSAVVELFAPGGDMITKTRRVVTAADAMASRWDLFAEVTDGAL